MQREHLVNNAMDVPREKCLVGGDGFEPPTFTV
jgi:hypothetical protein